MKIKAFYNRYNMDKGESPSLLISPDQSEGWYGRDPFEAVTAEKLSANLVIPPLGTTDGHNLMSDTTFADGLRGDHFVPISPLFVKDLAGRIIYIGFGPERKANAEWEAYQPKPAPDGTITEEDYNPLAPLVVFPRFCRDASPMEGVELLEQVFLTKFRNLEMSFSCNTMMSGSSDTGDEDDLVAATYLGANMYPYKLRLDTYYTDGFKLPQTQMLYAKGHEEGASDIAAKKAGEKLLEAWRNRGNATYAAWFEKLGQAEIDRLYDTGCTLIPTFEAANGYHVVGRDFGLEDYWPGRAVIGLHQVVERIANKAPAGTILDVVEPGYVTYSNIKPAKVIVSDGSGYVSPNAEDPISFMPNLYLPHSRVIDNWRATWIPTHPEHFEAPALWGWELNMGRFMQLSGPLWDPLHYYYESVTPVLQAYDEAALTEENPLVAVPHDMEHRFFPVIPMTGFDTFSNAAYHERVARNAGLDCSIKRIHTSGIMAGIGYHPLPAEFEFELDPFWFPEMHPLNRAPAVMPDDVQVMLVPIISPKVTVSQFVSTLDVPEGAIWFKDETRMSDPTNDAMQNYPLLVRYLVDDLDILTISKLCPMPFLTDPGDWLAMPAQAWWVDSQGNQLDGPLAIQEIAPNAYEALWDIRQKGVEIVKLRHMVYRTNLPLYIMAWWFSWSIEQLEVAMADWIQGSEAELEEPISVLKDNEEPAGEDTAA